MTQFIRWGVGEWRITQFIAVCFVKQLQMTQKSPGTGNLITLWRYVFMGGGYSGTQGEGFCCTHCILSTEQVYTYFEKPLSKLRM